MGQRKRRADGLLERKRTIDGKVVHFYGHTLAEVEQKIDDYKAALAETKAQGEKFSVVYDDWMKLRRTQIKPSTLYCSFAACARTREEWAKLFLGTDACVAPVLSPGEAQAHEMNAARGAWAEAEGVLQAAPAPRFAGQPDWAPSLGPERGAHTDEILAELGVVPG